jgi:hypothetical protein
MFKLVLASTLMASIVGGFAWHHHHNNGDHDRPSYGCSR